MTNIFWVSALLAAFLLAAWERNRSQRTLRRMDRMLEEAIRGGFHEQDFDESLL